MTGKRTLKERETLKERGKKKFLERLVEEEEAAQAIRKYQEEQEDYDDKEPDVPNFIR